MANPQPTDSHLRLANTILEAICFRGFTQNQLKIILFVLRLSYACGKKFAIIKNKSRFELAGVHKNYISKEIESLRQSNVLIVYPEISAYLLNKNFDEWVLPTSKGFSSKIYTTLLSENLNNYPQIVDNVHKLLIPSINCCSDVNKLLIQESINCGQLNSENPSPEQEVSTPIINNNYYIYNNYFEILKQVENYSFDVKKDSDMLNKLVQKYPDIDLIEAINDWAVYKLDNPLEKSSSPRSQINTWIKKGVGFGKYKKQQPETNYDKYSHLTVQRLDFELPKAVGQ